MRVQDEEVHLLIVQNKALMKKRFKMICYLKIIIKIIRNRSIFLQNIYYLMLKKKANTLININDVYYVDLEFFIPSFKMNN